ncbi:MAG TPA: protein kinase [Candidatus Sulfotelmatobacter sp.]|nr:protein kinase [Candidatus Sulfotelmatobacter sp.]
MTGQLVGHYRVLEKIGAGGMGEVFRARDERLGRDVALKLIRPASSGNPDHLRRFEQEARAAAALNHPNILAIYDVGFEGAAPYIVSELLEGKTLRERINEGAIPLRQASAYSLQVAHALVAAHERHIVHRDLKPENLFITHDDRIKVLDFGVAKLQAAVEENCAIESMTTVTKHGAVIGTVAYMSPEQLRAKAVDHRSDIFSFGAILYEMVTGRRAFRGETEVDTITAVLREEPPAANLEDAAIPAAFQDIIRHCLEKEPGNRFQSAKDLTFALQTLSGSSPLKPISSASRTRKTSVVPWLLVAMMAIAVVVVAAAALLYRAAPAPVYSRLTFEDGTVYAARFAPDGQSIIYAASWNDRPVRLFSTVGNSLLSQPLALNDANLLGISRANELALVLHGIHNGQMETMNGMLARAPVAGGSPREVLANVRWADWDPSGKLAVVHDVDGHSRIEYPIGKVLYESPGWISHIRFSPQGDTIAFMDHPALWDTRGVVSMVDTTGHVRSLTREWDCESGLAWRPDGKEVWFSAIDKGYNLNLMAVNRSGRLRTVLDLPVAINLEDIAPDGRVLFSLNTKRLDMAYAALDRDQDIDLSYHDANSVRAISSDGQFVVFEDSSEAAGPGYEVFMRKVDGSLPVRLGDGSAGGISPDGKWVLSISTSKSLQVTLLPIGPGQARTLNITGMQHVHNGFARFLPDGRRFAVNGDDAGHATRCYLVDVATANAKPISPEGITCGVFSPDGRAMTGSGEDGTSIYSLDGGGTRPMPRLSADFTPVEWSSDGSALYGYHFGEFPSKVYKAEIATGKETLVKELKPGVPAGVVLVAPIIASSDGKRFAYSYNQTLSVLYVVSGLN